MDPISIVLAAIVVGASAGVGDIAKDEVKQSYAVLKARILSKVGKHSQVEAAVGMLEENPSGRMVKEHLRKSLANERVDQDGEVVALATTVLDTAHTTAENVLRTGEGAEVTNSPQIIEADGETHGKLRNEMEVGKDAKVSGSGQSITIGPRPDRGRR